MESELDLTITEADLERMQAAVEEAMQQKAEEELSVEEIGPEDIKSA